MEDVSMCEGQDPPGSMWDLVLVGTAAAAAIPFITANLVILANRKRSYFQAQGGPILILTGSAAGLSWIVSSFFTNLQLPRHEIRKHDLCPLWSIWIFLAFGFCLWLACLILRLFRLLRISTSRDATYPHPSSCAWTFLYMLVLWAPSFIYSVTATSLGAVKSYGEGECRNCKMGSVWRICSFLILPVMYFTILIVLLLRCKNSKDYLVAREYSHTSEYALMAFIIYLLYGVDVLTGSYKKVSGRCFLTFCICSVVFFDFWVRMGWPVYLCLFKDSSKMDEFEDRLYSCGAECLRRLQTPSNLSQPSASPPQDLDWILRAIDMAMHEASEYKEKISQLELKKNALSSKVKQLGTMSAVRTTSPRCPKDNPSISAKNLKSLSYSKILY